MRRTLSLLTLAALFACAVFAEAQTLPASRPEVQSAAGTVEFGRVGSNGKTHFNGRSDARETRLNLQTYRGNVQIRFPDTSAILFADEVTYDNRTGQLTFSGNVRMKLDSK